LGKALLRLLDLVRREFRLPAHADAFGARNLPSFVGALDDAQAFVFGHCGHHRHEAAPHRGGKVDIAAVENLDRGSGIDHGLDDLQAVPHRARGPVPFGNHKLDATWRAARAVGDYDLNTFVIRADPVGSVAGLQPGMTVWLRPLP
jgi:hypothetical protein